MLIDDDTPLAASYAGAVSAGSARIALWRPARIEIDVDSELGGVLALHETWYPGWVAEIDGKRVPILRADVLFRGRRSAGRPPPCGRSASCRSRSTILPTRFVARCGDVRRKQSRVRFSSGFRVVITK